MTALWIKRFRLLWIAISLLIIPFSVYSQTPDDPNLSPESINQSGNFSFQETNESEKLEGTYQYGKIESTDGISEQTDAILNSAPEQNAIVIFDPENQPLDIPSDITNNKKVYRLKIPAIFTADFYRRNYVKPTIDDKILGIMLATGRGIPTAIIWFSSADPLQAALVTAYLTSVTYYLNAYHLTFDNFFTAGVQDMTSVPGKLYARLRGSISEMIMDIGIGNGTNILGGMTRTVTQTTLDAIPLNILNNASNASRRHLIKDDASLKRTYKVIYTPFLSILRSFQDLNHWPVLFSIGFYNVNVSMLGCVIAYSAMLTANLLAPNLVTNVLTKIRDASAKHILRVGAWINAKPIEPCDTIASGKTQNQQEDIFEP